MRIRAYAMLMRKAYARLMGRLMRDAYALLLHNVCAKIEFLVASTGGSCSPLCKAYAEISERDGKTTGVKTKTEGDRDTEREAEGPTEPYANRLCA